MDPFPPTCNPDAYVAREATDRMLDALETERADRDAHARSASEELQTLRTDHAAALVRLEAERDALMLQRDTLGEDFAAREAALNALVQDCVAALEAVANAPVPRAATGFVGRMVERLQQAEEAASVSQDAPGGG